MNMFPFTISLFFNFERLFKEDKKIFLFINLLSCRRWLITKNAIDDSAMRDA